MSKLAEHVTNQLLCGYLMRKHNVHNLQKILLILKSKAFNYIGLEKMKY